MSFDLSRQLFRSLGTHALKKITLSENCIEIIVAPWTDLDNEANAIFHEVTIEYIEAESGSSHQSLAFDLPWDIIRLDSQENKNGSWTFGLCCCEFVIGFVSRWPKLEFDS